MAFEYQYKFQQLKPLREKNNDQYAPDDQQIEQYAKYIGINLPVQDYMIGLAREGVMASLPEGWQACQTHQGQLVYRNIYSKTVQEEHPMDEVYRQKVVQLRQAYEKYEVQYQSDLNTIIQQKSEQKSEVSQKAEQLSFQQSSILKQELHSNFESPTIIEGQKAVSKVKKEKIQGKQSKSIEKHHERRQKQQLRQRLKEQLQRLKAQQTITLQLLQQIKKGNEARQKHIKYIIASTNKSLIK